MSTYPSLPLFVDAYLADAGHLTDAEHGRYLRLLMLIWSSPQCRIPNDDAWIARKLARSIESVATDIRPLIGEFCKTTGNWITQKRLKKEWERIRQVSRQRSEAGKSKSKSDPTKPQKDKEKSGSIRPNEEPQPRSAPIPISTPSKEESDGSARASEKSKPSSRSLVAPAASALADECRRAAGPASDGKPHDFYGLDYQAHVWIERGYDPPQVVLAFVQTVKRHGADLPMSYFAKAINSACTQPAPAQRNLPLLRTIETRGASHVGSKPGGLVEAGRRRLAQLAELASGQVHEPGDFAREGGAGDGGGNGGVRILSVG